MSSRNLPALPADVGSDVIDGEIVSDAPQRPVVIVLRPVVQVVKIVVRHEHSKTAGRHVAYVPLGVVVVVKRVWESRTTARYDRYIRAAERTGNHQVALEWDARRSEFIRARHQRRMERVESRIAVFRALPWIAASAIAVPAGLGVLLAIARKRFADIALPIEILAHITEDVAVVISVAWGPLVLAAPWVAVAALWHVGRNAAATTGPSWLRTVADGDDMPVDETTIARALEALRIPQVRDYLKGGLPLQYLAPCRVDGRGTFASIRLPAGVTAERIARRRADLATGLYRQAKEVWPGTGSEAGILDLWIADKGALAEGAGPYPLLNEGACDVFKGVPFGKTLRGDETAAPVMERNTITGGMPGQGKSSAARAIMAGVALDPTAELRIWVPDTNFDFEAFKPRCSRYVMGAEDECIRAIRDDLLDLRGEVQARGQLLIDYEVPAVTRELASAGVGLHPLVCLLEEAHVAIQHAVYGKEIAGLLIDIVKLGRKRGIHVIVSTQAPTRDSMPRDVTRNCSNGIAFAVGDHVANDALLGQGAYAAGHRATDLIPGTDRGTALVKGFSGERSEMIQVYFLDVAKGNDQVTPIIQRSLAQIARAGHEVPGTGRARVIEVRDLLADLDQVLGAGRVRLADVPALLRELAPGWGEYRAMTAVRLRDLLNGEGVRVTNTGNVLRLDPSDLRRVVAGREVSESAV
jgi:DNA segregation ATPase FtsK/SpoIIIE, S-DNA-T family